MTRLVRFPRIGFLLTFMFLTLAINFFHTETSITDSSNCPACHFLASSLSTSAAILFVLPPLLLLGALFIVEPLRLCETEFQYFFSRSPPAF